MVEDGSRFCISCGSPLAGGGAQRRADTLNANTCPTCHAPVDSDMRFCIYCGTALQPGDAGPAPDAPVGPNPSGAGGNPRRTGLIVAIAAVCAVALVAAIAAGVWWFALRDDGGDGGDAGSASSSGQGSEATDDADGDQDDDDAQVVCTAAPEAELESTDASGTTLIARFTFTSDECAELTFDDSDVRITVDDDSGNVVADAIYDFSTDPIELTDGEATVDLAFTTGQYWRPYDQIVASSMSVSVSVGEEPGGDAAGSVDGALGGASVDDADVERAAQLALRWQVSNDESTAAHFYSTYTTQLSSKYYGIEVEGKTWDYNDIYTQFLEKRAKHPNSLLVWSGDWPTYQATDTTYFYVILSGESFSTIDDAKSWCTSSGYTTEDCLPVDLQ